MSKVLLSSVAALAAFTSFGAIRAVTPDMWGGNTNCWQLKRHAEKMAVVTNGGAKVVFIGDSITHFWETNGKDQLKKYLGDGEAKMLNLGTSADRTEHVLWRLTEGKELDGYEAKGIFLMIGTNNSGHFPFAKEPPIDTILGIREIVRVIREKQPTATLVLTSIFPRGADAGDPCRRRNAVVNREIQKFADGKNVLWLDMDGVFTDADGKLKAEAFDDGLHPNSVGYEYWYTALRPYLEYVLSDRKVAFGRDPKSVLAANRLPVGVHATTPESRIPDGTLNDWWTWRLLQKQNEIADSNGHFDLVFFGDSITHNWETRGKASLAELRKTYSVLDIGYSADRTENLIWRGENGELDGYEATCVMLMIGTNNSWHRMDKPEDIAAGVKKVLETVLKKQPKAKVLLLPIFPFGDDPGNKVRVNNEKVNPIIRTFADGQRVIWVDFNEKWLDEKGSANKWTVDGCHPSDEGYKNVWLPAVLPYFKEIVGK